MKICTGCSGCGFYVDYDPTAQSGGVKVNCKTCKGRGWLSENGTSLEDEEGVHVHWIYGF